jgi:hypothetical protein
MKNLKHNNMKLKTISLSTICFLLITILIFSCQRSKNNSTEDMADGKDNALCESTQNDVLNMTDEVGNYGTLIGFKKSRACATFTIDTISIPHIITIDFGNVNCVCADGKTRNGKIIRTYTGKYKDSGSVHTITFDGYQVNGNNILGYKTVTNNGENANGNYNYTIDTKDTIIKANNAGTITWQSLRNREWLNGYPTPIHNDDEYSITGNGNGTRLNGNTWTMNITNPIIVDLSCAYRLTQGTMVITPSNKPARTIDYGNGTCDNQATLTVNGVVFPFTLN